MAGSVKDELLIYKDTFDDKSYTDVNRLANAMLTQADTLSPIVTNLFGKMSSRFPVMALTEGRNRIRTIKSVDGLFKVPVIGKPKKSSVIAKSFYSGSDKAGIGKTEFKLAFADRWFERDYNIEGPYGQRAKIVEHPVQEGDYWVYTCKLTGPNVSEYLLIKEQTVGARWGAMFAIVGISGSRGNASRNMAPSMMQNQVSFLRKSYQYKGNVQNKVMVLQIPTESGTTKLWCEYEAYQHSLMWKEECENSLWYARWNRDAEGVIHDKDINSGEITPEASGILEQIVNMSTYSYLTETKIKRIMRDVFFNSDAEDVKNIEIFVGTGSREEFGEALKNAFIGLGMQGTSDKFIGGSGNSLVYGAYFNTYKHQDGHTATIRYLPLLDKGARADKAPRHPISGLPITSYDMYFLDMSINGNGDANVQYVAEEGREDMEVFVPGLTIPKGYSGTMQRATDADESSVHFAKSLAAHIINPINSFKLFCDLV